MLVGLINRMSFMDASVFRLLYLILIGFAIMLGFLSPKKLPRILARMIIVPLVLLLLWSYLQATLAQLTTTQITLLVIALLILALLYTLLATEFGRNVLASFLGTLLFEIGRGFFRLVRGLCYALAAGVAIALRYVRRLGS